MTTLQVIYQYEQQGVIDVSISPLGTYVCTWERLTKPAEGTNTPQKNLLIHHIDSGTIITSYTHKQQSYWAPQWTNSESHYARLTTNEVQLFATKDLHATSTPTQRLKMDNVTAVSMSPGVYPHLAVFVAENRSGAPALVRVFSLNTLKVPIASKSFFKADKARFQWNSSGSGLLVLTSTDIDQSGQSYYGENNLYYLSTAGNYDCRVALDKEGPVHDIAWSPNTREFAVTYGFIPARTKLFNLRADPIFDFGAAPRNSLVFSPNARFLVIGGFGNLAGDMEFWDMCPSPPPNTVTPTVKSNNNLPAPIVSRSPVKLASATAHSATDFQWSPCGRYFCTATLSPRMRVDNGWKIWHYQGVCVATQTHKELLQLCWWPQLQVSEPSPQKLPPPPQQQPQSGQQKQSQQKQQQQQRPSAQNRENKLLIEWEQRALSPPPIGLQETITLAPKPTGVYRPPSARGTPSTTMMRRDDEDSSIIKIKSNILPTGQRFIPGYQPKPTGATHPNNYNNNANQGTKHKTLDKPNNKIPVTIIPVDSAAMTSDLDSAQQKKIRNIIKKLGQIEDLKKRRDDGCMLEITQLNKIASESALRKELEGLA